MQGAGTLFLGHPLPPPHGPPHTHPCLHCRRPAPLQVRWHRSLDEVGADCPTLYIAHEFFDALPVHQFQRTGEGPIQPFSVQEACSCC